MAQHAVRDLHHSVVVRQALSNAVYTTDQNGVVIDRQGFESLELVAIVGNTADVLSATDKIELRIQHGDLSDGTDMAGVTSKDDLLGVSADVVAGLFALIDAPTEDDAVFKIGYRGPKRFVRFVLDFSGTHTNGNAVGAVALLGAPGVAPVVLP